MKLSNKQKKILGWVLLSPFLLFMLLGVISLLVLFPKPVLFIVCTIVGMYLIVSGSNGK